MLSSECAFSVQGTRAIYLACTVHTVTYRNHACITNLHGKAGKLINLILHRLFVSLIFLCTLYSKVIVYYYDLLIFLYKLEWQTKVYETKKYMLMGLAFTNNLFHKFPARPNTENWSFIFVQLVYLSSLMGP